MSVSLILVPLAVAAVAAWQASRVEEEPDGRLVCQVGTRMRDLDLLTAALADTGAQVQTDADALLAQWQGVEARFDRDEQGIWTTHLTGDVDEARAVEIVTAVDAAYGRRVQQAVLERLRQRAPAAGMEVASETTVGEDVTMVLTVTGQA